MSYQVLARKWRPRTFSAIVGQPVVVRALTSALTQQRLHHAYLFTGTRGVGKTTLARIMAKALNCEKGISADPCGQCASCLDIDAGRYADMLEIDAATNTKVEEMRQLLDNTAYLPSRGRFNVYIIDEVHMLSNAAFNAMLKTLEEPPEHLKFILATTDPQKIPVTVLSRCLQFNLRQIPEAQIAKHLSDILRQENIAAEEDALNLVAHAADGSMRDALSILDQAIAHGGGKVTSIDVSSMLGVVGASALYAVLDALVEMNPTSLFAVAQDFSSRAASFDYALQELATLFHHLALHQVSPTSLTADEAERLAPYSAKMDKEYLQLAYQIVLHGRRDLHLSPDEQAGFTMTLLRLYTFYPLTPTLEQLQALPTATITAPPAIPIQKPAEPTPLADVKAAGAEPQQIAGQEEWEALIKSMELTGALQQLAIHCAWVGMEGVRLNLHLPSEHRLLLTPSSLASLQEKIGAALNKEIRLKIEVVTHEVDTPARRQKNDLDEQQKAAEQSLHAEPFVHQMKNIFGVEPEKDSIKTNLNNRKS